MAVVVFKAPCASGSYYYAAGPEERSIPDEHMALIYLKNVIVIEDTSEVQREAQPIPGTLLREHDWLRKATAEENVEVQKLRQQETAPRRANVIAGTKV
jgi:hypothetical protein